MAKKQLTPEEYKAKLEIKAAKGERFTKVFLSTLAVLLSLVIVFSLVSIATTTMATVGKGGSVAASGNNTNTNTNTPPAEEDEPAMDWDAGDDTNAPAGDNGDGSGAQQGDAPATGGFTNRDALDLFKKSVTNARSNAKSVIRVKDGAINYKGIVEAGGLSSVASSLMGMFMAADEASIEEKNEEWDKSKLPNASALTTEGIKKLSYEDKGDTYVITIIAKDAVNPKANGDGVGAIAGVIEEGQITGAIGSVPGLALSNINIAYENVTAVAVVEKSTGNLLEYKINAPCVLGLDAKLALISINGAKVGIQVITEYKISY